MATIRCEVTISKNGEVIERFPSTAKALANKIGKTKAERIGGKFEVKEVKPAEYNPANW